MQQQENTTRSTSATGVETPAIRRAPTSTNVASPSTTATPPARNEGPKFHPILHRLMMIMPFLSHLLVA